MARHEIPASGGLALRVEEGQRLRIITPKGAQAADFFAYVADDLREWLSPAHSWVTTRSVKPRPGDTFLSRFRRPLLDFVEDGAGGMHDMMIAACDQARYEQFGFVGPHASCSENLRSAMARLGHPIDVIPQPVNFFTNTVVEADGKLVSPPNTVPPGGYVELLARMELICVVSSCPFDLQIPGWTINASGGPTELVVEVR
ncbi:MAG TPA: urea carboxylase-associated family protein [Methylomirabilota bacterium]|nr:urea carboxylase-associated family protein [Methylomirabilota bacterium]